MGGFDSRQLQEMLAQAQKQAQELQQKMQQTIVEASSGGGTVRVKMNGQKQILQTFIDPAAVCAMFHCRSSVNERTGAVGPSDSRKRLKSRFMPYLSTIEQSRSLLRPSSAPEQAFHSKVLLSARDSRTLGILAGSTITAPC